MLDMVSLAWQIPQCIWCNRVFTNANLKTSNLNEHYNNWHGSVQPGNDFSTWKSKGLDLIVVELYYSRHSYQWKNNYCWHVVKLRSCVARREPYTAVEEFVTPCELRWWQYYLPSDKGYKRILWKLRGYECVERLRTTVLKSHYENQKSTPV